MKFLIKLFACTTFALTTDAFSTDVQQWNVKATTAVHNSQLMASRRDILTNAVVAAAAAVLIPPNVAEAASEKVTAPATATATKTTAPSFQGVFSDPKHPKGYRVIVSKSANSAFMELSDGVPKDGGDAKIYNFPVKVTQDKKLKTTSLAIDFSPKGGPKGVIGTLSEDGNSISFPDGNKWKKNSGVEGVYNDPNHPKGYRVIRKQKGSTLAVELMNEPNKKAAKSTFITAKSGAGKKNGTYVQFDFPGSDNTVNKIKGSFADGIITFPDGNKWTKF